MSIALREPPDLDGDAGSGIVARRAVIRWGWRPADLIEKQNITAGTRQSVQLRAESPHGHYNSPLLSLVSGTYPAGPVRSR